MISIGVRLIGIGHAGAVVTGVSHAIRIEVRLADVGEQRAIVDGDATSAAIAAASIVAKVTRDRYMHRADILHPGWSFAEHVGYSTPSHREAILRNGVSPLHRMSFQSLAYQQLAL